MININKGVENEFVLYLKDEITLTEPYFIFEFTDEYGRVDIITLEDISTADSYNEFSFIEGTDLTLESSGSFNVYESATDTDDLDECSLIYDSMYKLIQDTYTTYTYNPTLDTEDYVYHPTFTSDFKTLDGILQVIGGYFQVLSGNYKINI